mmetsp:Transcript_17305/g.43722  ORF Transcript_17305/g.43722 Transcript_17305/m.43722 type:complete len:93 (-) Transcript_17305:86-364(-)
MFALLALAQVGVDSDSVDDKGLVHWMDNFPNPKRRESMAAMYYKWNRLSGCSDSTSHCLPKHHQTFGKSYGNSYYRGDGNAAEIGSGFFDSA